MSNTIPLSKNHSSVSVPVQSSETDVGFLLPSDDQLDYFVDKLCENIPRVVITTEINNSKNSSITSSTESDPGDNERNDLSCDEEQLISSNKTDHGNHHRFRQSDKRSLFNNDLNIAIMQCSATLEMLSERRKNLEVLVQQQLNGAANINCNFSYAPRLPDSPTRVDRLMYDISRERCRILGLMPSLDQTILSFKSKTTKDDIRKLLVSYGNSILDVMKERQSEIVFAQNNGTSADYDTGVLKLVQLIGQVNRMNRAVHTALWCIEVKIQVNLTLQKTRAGMTNAQNGERSPQRITTAQKSWQGFPKNRPASLLRAPLSPNTKPTQQAPGWMVQRGGVYKVQQQNHNFRKTINGIVQDQGAEIVQRF